MSTKKNIWLFVFIGSSVGAYLPVLWGGSIISYSSVFLSAAGGIAGIWLGLKIGNSING